MAWGLLLDHMRRSEATPPAELCAGLGSRARSAASPSPITAIVSTGTISSLNLPAACRARLRSCLGSYFKLSRSGAWPGIGAQCSRPAMFALLHFRCLPPARTCAAAAFLCDARAALSCSSRDTLNCLATLSEVMPAEGEQGEQDGRTGEQGSSQREVVLGARLGRLGLTAGCAAYEPCEFTSSVLFTKRKQSSGRREEGRRQASLVHHKGWEESGGGPGVVATHPWV